MSVQTGRSFSNGYGDCDEYGTQGEASLGRYFFQRFYDETAIRSRLLCPIDQEPSTIRWFGETSAGRLTDYEQRWIRKGRWCTVDDPREIADNYWQFSTYEEMPGVGLCALMIEKGTSAKRD
ncbi:MAG: hypothetical protein M1358_20300 [Chloroflexi bacterium]|nr:hypothetical protein [Chloroflexota bacterium]